MRKFRLLGKISLARFFTVPWKSNLPSSEDQNWKNIGKKIVNVAQNCDTGEAAFNECCLAREQLESVIQSVGYDMNVSIFGGLITLKIFEVGGDVDFVGVSDIEPGTEEASEIVKRVASELNYLGLKAWPLPKARVPVLKVDRISKSFPGSPLHNLSRDGVFQFIRQLNNTEAEDFTNLIKENYGAKEVEWDSMFKFATARFNSTSSLMYALPHAKSQNKNIILSLPVDIRYGPEIYRFPFDFCLSSTGLRNSYLLGEALFKYPYSRHLLLILKKWGRACGTINSIDGLLASYALTVMLVHFLVKVEIIPIVSTEKNACEPHLLEVTPRYQSLASGKDGDMAQVGFLFALFLEYFGNIFDYTNNVVCTSDMNLTKKSMGWDKLDNTNGKPPFFEFGIKDPYGKENIGRNLDLESTIFVQEAHISGLRCLLENFNDPDTSVHILTQKPPIPKRTTFPSIRKNTNPNFLTKNQLEAKQALGKMRFHERKKSIENFGKKAIKNAENQDAASRVTKDILGWIRNSGSN
ncbi:unnamed protein product [Phytomonas sp. Hart1]|nr:unnamed protein product [Phytomonas sp. Hart1]|eukprot:CCW68728.1 unnamed protein product [Phytomonas sp. isolate Hart1]